MTKIDPVPTVAAAPPRSAFLPLAAGATAFGVCCGLPLLASAGVAGVAAGLGARSWIAVAVASLIAIAGVIRWRRRPSCDVSPDQANPHQMQPAPVGGATHSREAGR